MICPLLCSSVCWLPIWSWMFKKKIIFLKKYFNRIKKFTWSFSLINSRILVPDTSMFECLRFFFLTVIIFEFVYSESGGREGESWRMQCTNIVSASAYEQQLSWKCQVRSQDWHYSHWLFVQMLLFWNHIECAWYMIKLSN